MFVFGCLVRHNYVVESGFVTLYSNMQPRVLAYFKQSRRVSWLAEDLTADTFLRAWRFKPNATLDDSAYVWQVAKTTLRDQYRWKRGHGTRADVVGMVGVESAVRGLEYIADVLDVRQAITTLSPTQARVVRMYYLDDAPMADIAQSIGKSKSRAKHIVAESRELLRTALAA